MIRKFVSMTVLFSFLILFLSSFVLYVIPGAQSGAAGWAFMGLGRMQWTELHISSGLAFLAFGLWHTILNFKSLVFIFRKAASVQLKSLWPVLGALALNLFIVLGTLGHHQPVEGVLSYYQQTKQEFRGGRARGKAPTELSAGRAASEVEAAGSASPRLASTD